MHITLFGGAFDPPHNAHLDIARYLRNQKMADEVWFVPVYEHPWAKRLGKEFLTPYHHRHHMISLMQEKSIKVAEFRDVSYTYPTITHFQKRFPQHHFSWVMGSEYLTRFADFLKLHPRLIDIPIFIYPREGHPFDPLYPNMTALVEAPLVTISSTDVRNLIKEGQPASHLVPDNIASYIKNNLLYQ
jgi:nicotinate-nucleotide adenylyltransferase